MRLKWSAFGTVVAVVLAAAASPARGGQREEFFESKIRPLLLQECGGCHGEKVQMGGIRLTERGAFHRAGVVMAGDVEASRLVQAVRYGGAIKMPPSGKLEDAEVEALERWVAEGAHWPELATPAEVPGPGGYWAFQAVAKPQPPAVGNEAWPRSAIDRFILAKLEEKRLTPAGDADKYTLLRRATLDLTGLLPTPAEIQSFVNDTSPEAFQNAVECLLDSPAYGERWGRHWLDVTYYADTTGVGRRIPLKQAWRYRDYVVNSFNADKPFNRFVHEQIAGPGAWKKKGGEEKSGKEISDDERAATGFLVLGPWAWFLMDRTQLRMDVADLQIDLIGRTLLGLTLGCARCHDHKFDAITTEDYYALAGIFRSTRTLSKDSRSGGVNLTPLPVDAAAARRYADEMEKWEKRVSEAEADDEKYAEQQEEIEKRIKKLEDENPERKSELEAIQAELASIKKKRGSARDRQIAAFTRYMKPALPHVYAAADMDFPEDAHLAIRGDAGNQGDLVKRGFPSALSFAGPAKIKPRSSGRKELADWIVDEGNPLTSRVYVNRVWRHLFGRGIVATTDNFGTRGQPPTHPQLLDYLAAYFVENGWSTKKLIREIVLSRGYQLAGTPDPKAYEVDAANTLLWRANRRRIEVEAVRDTVLQLSGRLDRSRGGPSLPLTAQNVHTIAPFFLEEDSVIGDDVKFRRTVYQPIMRGGQMTDLDILNLFDFADPDQVVGARASTTVPTQMLYLMNSPFLKTQAELLAERLVNDDALDEAGRVKHVILRALSRPAGERDIQQARQFVSDFSAALAKSGRDAAAAELAAWTNYCHAIFVSSEFLYRR